MTKDDKVSSKLKRKWWKVSFDEESVPKHVAEQLLSNETGSEPRKKKRQKRNKNAIEAEVKGPNSEPLQPVQHNGCQEKGAKEKKSKFKVLPHQAEDSETPSAEKAKKKKPKIKNEDEMAKEGTEVYLTEKRRKKQKVEEYENTYNGQESAQQNEIQLTTQEVEEKTKNKKRKKDITLERKADSEEVQLLPEMRPKKKKKKVVESEDHDSNASESTAGEKKKKESIRERKRKKFAKLMEEKKHKADRAVQEKSLNYLSKWKHSRGEWKFEKLRQIWLLQHMYDSDKIPEEFWDTLVSYFGDAKGKVRELILKEAVKIIDEKEQEDEENGNGCRRKRARDMIQHLEE